MSDLNAMNLEPGEIVGGYELISRLGGGAMGSVWQVGDGGGQTYAMKILRDSFAEEDSGEGIGVHGNGGSNQPINDYGARAHERDQLTARERLRREAMALQKVRHPGVCGIVDMELDDSLAFIVTELIEGKNLRQDVAANGRYTGDDLERLARKLIDAVKAVHAAGIVHRDIKPTNVMVSASGPVLVDFGIAMGEGESHVTRTGLVMGTPGFIAPEIIDGAESNEATDWWSLASVLAFSATGHPVFGTKPMMAVLEREASGNANLTGLPAGTMAALRSALDPDQRRRCSPDELLRAIALDALNPVAWEDAQTDSAGQSGQSNQPHSDGINPQESQSLQESQRNGVVRPFDSTVVAAPRAMALRDADPENPRTLWHADEAATQPLTISGAAADAAVGRTAVLPQRDTAATPAWESAADAPGEETTKLPYVQPNSCGPNESNAAMGTTVIASADRPALQRLIGSAAGCEPAATVPLATVPATVVAPTAMLAAPAPAFAPASEPAPGFESVPKEFAPAQQATAYDPADIQQVADRLPNPADIRRAQLLTRGRIALWMLMVPLGLLAAGMPMVTLLSAVALLWMIFTAGFNESGQLNREYRRGGVRKGGDAALRLAALPWHIVKSLPAALAHGALLCAAASLVIVPSTYMLHLSVARAYLHLRNWAFPLPLLAGGAWSSCAAVLGAAGAFGWLAATFGTRSTSLLLGAGALFAAPPKIQNGHMSQPAGLQPGPPYQQAPQASTNRESGNAGRSRRNPSRRRVIMLTLWIAVTLAALTVLASNQPISWEPLMAMLS
jgi:serine/threonine protein kinase